MSDQIMFLDLETTGLNPEKDLILEVAAVVVDGGTMTAIDAPAFNSLVTHGCHPAQILPNKYVRGMHEKSGLWTALIDAYYNGVERPLYSVESDLLRWAFDIMGSSDVLLAGYSIQFDRGFIKQHMPRFEAALSHRMIDVSTMRWASNAWFEPKAKQEAKHRALDDCHEAIAELSRYKARIFDLARSNVPAVVSAP